MTGEITQSPEPESRHLTQPKIIGGTIATLAVVAAGLHGVGQALETDPKPCPEVGAEALATTTNLLDHPDKIEAFKQSSYLDQLDAAGYWGIRKHTARRLGLTINLFVQQQPTMYVNTHNPSAVPLSAQAYFDATEEFVTEYGVTLEVPTDQSDIPSKGIGSPLNTANLSDKELKALQYTTRVIADDMSALPVEFIQSIGMKHIYFVDLTDKKAAGKYDPAVSDSIYLDPLATMGPESLTHEITHMWDNDSCSGSNYNIDPGFESLNPAPIYKDDEKTDQTSTEYTSQEYIDTSKKIQRLLNKIGYDSTLSKSAYRALKAKYKTYLRNTVVTKDYSFKAPIEDKATLGEAIFDPQIYSMYRQDTKPVIRDKFTYLVARLYERSPKIAKYFIAMGSQ